MTGIAWYITSCHQTEKKETGGPAVILKQRPARPSSAYKDTLLVEAAAAVFYRPDSMQLTAMQSSISKADYESMNHDCYYQVRHAKKVIKEKYPQLLMLDAEKYRWLHFRSRIHGSQFIDTDSLPDPFGLWLFDPSKTAEAADMMNVETALAFYFPH